MSGAFGGGVLLADTSAWARSSHPAVVCDWSQAMRDNQIATCSLVVLELLYSERDPLVLRSREADLGRLRDIAVSESAQRAARAAMRSLAGRGPSQHQVPTRALLIAAAAEEAGVGVVHYDRVFDRLADVLGFESRWLAPAGSLQRHKKRG